GQQTAGRFLDQIQRLVETLPAAIKRIGHVLDADMRREIEKAPDLVAHAAWRKLDQLVQVRAVHGEQKIEAVIVAGRDLPRALARDVDAAILRRRLGAGVGGLADMPVAEAGRIDIEEIEHAFLLGDAAEYALGHGRAADIAETHEEEPLLGHVADMAPRRDGRKAPPYACRSQAPTLFFHLGS